MKSSLKSQLVALIILVASVGFSQSQDLNFKLISSESGITLGKINSITQDPYGYLWLIDQTSRSLLRFDGDQLTKYTHSIHKPNSLGGHTPECVTSDSSGVLWIGFYGQGLDRFDPATNIFTHFQNDPEDPESLGNDVISAVMVDRKGMVWIGTQDGLDRLDPTTGKFIHFTYDKNDSTSLSHNHVRSIYEDSKGDIWVGTGFQFFRNNDGGLNRFDAKTNSFTRYLHNPNDPHSLMDNKVRTIFEDSRGNFWIGTGKNGLHTMNRESGKFTRFVFDPEIPGKLSTPEPESWIAHITFIIEDGEGNIWIGTYENGIVRYNPNSETTTLYGTDGILPGDLTENSSWSAYVATDGIIWISTQQSNLYKINPHIQRIHEVSEDGLITSIFKANENDLWIGSWNNGLIRQDINTGSKSHYQHRPGDPNSLSNNSISKLYLDKKDQFWIGSRNGLSLFNKENNSFINFEYNEKDPSSLSHPRVNEIYEDRDNNFWIGTGGGLNKMDRESGKFFRYDNNPSVQSLLSNVAINKIISDNESNLWIGTGDGLVKIDPKTEKTESHLTGLNITDLYMDYDGILWTATLSGLYYSSKDLTNFQPFTSAVSGIFVGEIIRSIIADEEDNLWLGTSGGIIKIDKGRENRTVYALEHGVNPAEFHALSRAHKGLDGTLYFSSSPSGFYAFHPQELKDFPESMNLYFSNFWVNNKLKTPKKDGILKQSIIDTKSIKLKHNENIFSFIFTRLDFSDIIENRILYKMEPYDADWTEIKSGQKINYTKVPPGNYTLKIKSPLNNRGDWVEKTMNIFISKPWWKTLWAYMAYGIIIGFLVWRFYLAQKARTIRIERQKSQDRELEQAREIEKAYKELGTTHENLKATQAQLIQSEKMASLGELTAGIAHEIQNPLNFVNNFSEVNTELIDELVEEINEGNYDEVKELAKDIKSNEEKIKHHGSRADSIVKGMLKHSRTNSGEKTPTDINAICDEYLRLAYHGLRAKDNTFNAKLETDFDESIGNINVVAQDISRVILNLITNAFQACGADGLVKISTKKLEDKIEVSVQDNGSGIPDDIKDKIFQPFFTTKDTGQGTGLGLSLAYDIVKAHGGELKVESPPAGQAGEEGKGTKFTIELPI